MSYVLARPSSTRRSSMLAIVIALHAGIVLLVLAAKTVAPQIMAMPIVVDLLRPPEVQKEPEAKPLPVTKPQPQRQKPVPTQKTPVPAIETTTSTAPANNAVTAPAPDTKAQPGPASDTLSQPRFDADYLRNPAPPYPALSKRMGEEGKVILRVLVSPHGTAESVELKTSSGSPRLDESALQTVRHWKFIPAKRGDTAVQSWVLVPILFKLEH